MSICPNALSVLEHEAARPLEPLAALDSDDDLSIVPPQQPPLDPARDALNRTCLTVKRIAADIGMPRATLEAYRLGTRRMPRAARVRLGTYLASHAAMLDTLAQTLIAPADVMRE